MGDGRSNYRGSSSDEPVAGSIADDSDKTATLIGHFYRGEMERVTTWRTRLDQTTNWAVVIMAAILTWAFSSPDNPHYVLLIGAAAVGAFLIIEAQRYQEYDAWRSRVRLLQENLFAEVYSSEGPERPEWREQLGSDLREPSVRIPFVRALGHRLQRVYFPLFTVLVAAWALRITVFETEAPWYRSAAVAELPGPAIVGVVGVCYLLLGGLTFWSFHRSRKREFDSESLASSPDEER